MIRSPVCVTVHLNVSGPCASFPVPIHVPVRFAADGVVVVGVVLGAAGEDPQPVAATRSAATMSGARGLTGRVYDLLKDHGHDVGTIEDERRDESKGLPILFLR